VLIAGECREETPQSFAQVILFVVALPLFKQIVARMVV